MNKKTGEFSAADLKKSSGRKQPKQIGIGRLPDKRIRGQFICKSCGVCKPDAEIGREYRAGQMCKTCDTKVKSIVDGTFRQGTNTLEAYQRAKNKAAAKAYKAGRLPKWMYS